MNISEHLTQRQFQDIIMTIFHKLKDDEQMEAKDLIEEIKRRLLAATSGEQTKRQVEE